MTITALCDTCGREYQAPDTLIGKRVKCKGCGNVFTVTDSRGGFVSIGDDAPPEPQVDFDALAEMERNARRPIADTAPGAGGTRAGTRAGGAATTAGSINGTQIVSAD